MKSLIKKTRKIFSSKWFIFILYQFYMVYSSTFRLTIINRKQWEDYLEGGGKVLMCVFHQQFTCVLRPARQFYKYKPAIMISQSRDGDIAAEVSNLNKWHAVRGSSSRGGFKALKQMVSQLRQYNMAAHIVDGPQGPAGTVKQGTIALAQLTGSAIVPFYVAADRAWYLNSWDRFMIPKPFAHLTVRFEDLIRVESLGNTLEEKRHTLERMMQKGLILPK
jgi:lysophospholipid acyltransferase (LPLAT)-like uncharacterized protein